MKELLRNPEALAFTFAYVIFVIGAIMMMIQERRKK